MIKISALPYPENPADLFYCLLDRSWSIFLDSGFPYINRGRYDILAADPAVTLETTGETTRITSKHNTIYSTEAPLSLLKHYLGSPQSQPSNLPFYGGALGYFAYDLAAQIDQMCIQQYSELALPDMAIGIYHWAVIIDHHQRKAYLSCDTRHADILKKWSSLQKLFIKPRAQTVPEPTSYKPIVANMTAADYANRFARAKQYIQQGDCYQVNLAQRFSGETLHDNWTTYLQLRTLNPAPYAAFLNLPNVTVLSSSPERFLRIVGEQVETKPIKGTRPRAQHPDEDKALARELLQSDKDRAENLMIVDLLRNDLGRICQTGSIQVPKLFALESYATVHHLVSTVTGRLRPDSHALDVLHSCLPGGSITGAPKRRAMEIIAELEPHRRHIYCGAIGYIGFNGNMDTNIAIRTMLQYKDQIYFWAGGGIVADSKLETEYRECFDKAAAMMTLLGHKI